jgi:hypothetical protein
MYSREDYVRTPVRGIRQRLRIALRKEGFIGKFETAHLRRDAGINKPCLIVIAKSGQTQLPLFDFEGMNVYLKQDD